MAPKRGHDPQVENTDSFKGGWWSMHLPAKQVLYHFLLGTLGIVQGSPEKQSPVSTCKHIDIIGDSAHVMVEDRRFYNMPS